MSSPDPHTEAADAVHEGRPVEAQFTRQGKGGRRISVVLGLGLALTALGFIIMYLVFGGALSSTNANDGDQAVDAAAFSDRQDVPAADAPTTATGEPTSPPTGDAPNVNAPTVQASPSSQ